MLRSSTAGAEGAGVIATSASVASGYVALTQEQAAFPSYRAGAAGDQPAGRLSARGPARISDR